MKTVMCFGTFDGLHPGHLNYFSQAKRHGEHVVVVVARDSNVVRIKGAQPRHGEEERLQAVQRAANVDHALLGSAGTDWHTVVKNHAPDVIALGYDQKADEAALRDLLPATTIVRLAPYLPRRYKSSLLNSSSHAPAPFPANRN